MAERIRTDTGEFTADEIACFERALHMEEKVGSGAARTNVITTKHSTIHAETAYVGGVLFSHVKCLIRAEPIDVLAFYMNTDSLIQTKYERGSSTKELKTLEIVNDHHIVVYASYSTPFSDREFVGDVLWRQERHDQYFMVNVPANHDKAPPSRDVVRGESIRAIRLREMAPGVTNFTLMFTMDLKGNIPSYITNNYVIPGNLEIPLVYQRYFQLIKPMSEFDKNGEDAKMLAQLLLDDIESKSSAADRLAALQLYFIRTESLRFIATTYPWFEELLWHIIDDNQPMQICLPRSTTLSAFSPADATAAGRSFATCLRGSLTPQLAVNMWFTMWDPAMAQLDAEFPLFLRPFVTRVAKCLLDKGVKNSVVLKVGARMSETQFETSEAKLGSSSIPQTKVVAKFTLGVGSLASSLTEEQRVLAATRQFSEMRTTFDRSVEIDQRGREKFCKVVQEGKEDYDKNEMGAVARGLQTIADYDAQKNKRWAKSASPLTESTTSISSKKNEVWGRATTTVRVPAAEVLAFFWNSKARCQEKADTLEKTYIEEPNRHNRLEYLEKVSPKPFAPRYFCNRIVWASTAENALIFSSFPEKPKHERVAIIGAAAKLVISVTRRVGSQNDEADVELISSLDFGGISIPLPVLEYLCSYNLRRITFAEQYFQGLRRLSEYDEKDGVAVGEMFVMKTKEEERKKKKGTNTKKKAVVAVHQIRVANVVSKHVALKEFAKKNPWFPSLVEGMLSHWLVDPAVIKTKLDNLSNKEALAIGKTFAMAVFGHQISEAAADMFCNEYLSLVELRKRERFFGPMVVTIGQRKIERAVWGLAFKVATGAMLGVLDVATDVNAISNFMLHGGRAFARALLVSIALSMTFQVLLVYGNGKKRGFRHMAKDVLIVLTGLKPTVDAFRVLNGAKAHVDDLFDPQSVFNWSKIAEM